MWLMASNTNIFMIMKLLCKICHYAFVGRDYMALYVN